MPIYTNSQNRKNVVHDNYAQASKQQLKLLNLKEIIKFTGLITFHLQQLKKRICLIMNNCINNTERKKKVFLLNTFNNIWALQKA